jgi:hypothetical protein
MILVYIYEAPVIKIVSSTKVSDGFADGIDGLFAVGLFNQTY